METVNKIREIFFKNDITVIEDHWLNDITDIFSCSLRVVNTNIYSNGKGTTYEYALASAYGEMIERIQNFASFKVDYLSSNNDLPFKYDYHESTADKNSCILDACFSDVNLVGDYGKLSDLFENSLTSCKDDITLLHFKNISKDRTVQLPTYIVKYYKSNGMASGNTIDEAIVQSLSEILERYAIREICINNAKASTIPNEIIKQKYPDQYKIIEEIEQSGRYRVIVKDCSLNKGLPVIGIVVFDRNTGGYIPCFGAEPVIAYALERTLTEAFQGRMLKNIKRDSKLLSLNREISRDELEKGYEQIVVWGNGILPMSFFCNNSESFCEDFADAPFADSKEKKAYLIKLIEELGYEILIRETSFMGFPTIHIIVPGLSEIDVYNTNDFIKEKLNINKLDYYRNIKNLTDSELRDFLIDIKFDRARKIDKSLISSLADYLPIEFTHKSMMKDISLAYLLCLINIKLKDYAAAFENMEKLLADIDLDTAPDAEYFTCARQYLLLKKQDFSDESIRTILLDLYLIDTIEEVIYDLKDDNLFNNLPEVKCPDCSSCEHRCECYQFNTETLYNRLKNRMKEHYES